MWWNMTQWCDYWGERERDHSCNWLKFSQHNLKWPLAQDLSVFLIRISVRRQSLHWIIFCLNSEELSISSHTLNCLTRKTTLPSPPTEMSCGNAGIIFEELGRFLSGQFSQFTHYQHKLARVHYLSVFLSWVCICRQRLEWVSLCSNTENLSSSNQTETCLAWNNWVFSQVILLRREATQGKFNVGNPSANTRTNGP